MQRTIQAAVLGGLVAVSSAMLSGQADASLLKPDATRSYPDIAADINGTVSFDAETGVFEVINTPYLIAGGNSAASEFPILPTADGVRSQVLRLRLDSSGNLLDDPINTYEMHGHIEANGEVFSGLLLKGNPTDFGYLNLGPVTGSDGTSIDLGVDLFDVDVDVTDGALAEFFGDSFYMRITPELESTFNGNFAEDFTALKATSNTRSYVSEHPFPIPEPTTIAVLLAGGLGLAYRHRRRLALRSDG
ncbi:hypothetical protein BH23PLA1_BH23PLA1_32770 [soil metagenome]